MSINNPSKLVEEFKRSGDFDRIRRELLAQFQNSEYLAAFKSRVEDVARQRLTSDHNLLYMPQEFIHRELMQELDRFPIVERSTSELPMLNDPALSTRIGNSLEKILKDQGITVKQKGDPVKETATTAPSVVGGSDKVAYPAPPEGTNKQLQPPKESDSHRPVLNSSNHNEGIGKAKASTPIPPEKELERKQNKDSDSMDLDED